MPLRKPCRSTNASGGKALVHGRRDSMQSLIRGGTGYRPRWLSLSRLPRFGVADRNLSSSWPLSTLALIVEKMPNCRKLPSNSSRAQRLHAKANASRARDALAMSVIEEEPADMRESRLKEQERHPEDIKPSSDSIILQGRPSAQTRPEAHAPRSPMDSQSSEQGFDHHEWTSRVLRPTSGSRPVDLSTTIRLPSNHRPIPSHHERPKRSDPEYTPRSKPSSRSFSSSEEEEEAHDHHRRPPRRHANPHSSTRPKASSIPPSRASMPSRRERHHSPHRATKSPSSSSDEMARRSKPPTKFDSTHSPFEDAYRKRHPNSRSSETGPPKSSSVHRSSSSKEGHRSSAMPSRRVPGHSSDRSISKSSGSHADRKPSPRSPSSPSDISRAQSSSTLASLSETESYEDRRLRAFRDVSPPPRQRSTSNPKPVSKSYVGVQRHASSCREARTPVTMNPKLMAPSKPGKDEQRKASSHRLLSSQDPSRIRSTSLLPKQSAKSTSSEGSLPRSASASSLSSLGSTPSPRKSVPRTPLRLRHYEGRFSNRRGQTLFYFSLFPPEKMALRGVVLCLHGIGDHCRRNVAMYERLCREGFGVITYDLLNHGVSDLDQHKTRAHISNFSHLVEDTNDFVTFAKRSIFTDALRYWRKHQHPHHPHGRESSSEVISQPELPLIIAGTSFGSLIGLHTVLSEKHKFHAAVWGSPAVGVTWNPLLWAESKLARPLAAIIPTAKVVPAVQHDLLCRDPKFLRRFKADPLTSMDMMTTRSGHESLQAMIQLQDDKRVTDAGSAFCAVPTLFLAGSADGISDQQAAIKFFATMGNFDKEFKLFDGLFHMVYEEPEKEDVLRYLAKWLHRRFPVETRP
uniref:Serine aminopeptidase S33 domain-containing protein n=1 Tax=Phytophthora ramorum TaxID=164328 RepID=H3GP81_PHYRM